VAAVPIVSQTKKKMIEEDEEEEIFGVEERKDAMTNFKAQRAAVFHP
jgi:hypothetical protein